MKLSTQEEYGLRCILRVGREGPDASLTIPELARAEGIAEGGYRLISNVGRWGGQTVDHLHIHLMGGRAFDWPPG